MYGANKNVVDVDWRLVCRNIQVFDLDSRIVCLQILDSLKLRVRFVNCLGKLRNGNDKIEALDD